MPKLIKIFTAVAFFTSLLAIIYLSDAARRVLTDPLHFEKTTHRSIPKPALPRLCASPRTFEPIAVPGLVIQPEDVEYAQRLCVPLGEPSLGLLGHELRLWGPERSFHDF